MIRADKKNTKHSVKYLAMLFPRTGPLIPRLKSSYTPPPPLKKQRHFCLRISVFHKMVGTRNFLSPSCNKPIEDSLMTVIGFQCYVTAPVHVFIPA